MGNPLEDHDSIGRLPLPLEESCDGTRRGIVGHEGSDFLTDLRGCHRVWPRLGLVAAVVLLSVDAGSGVLMASAETLSGLTSLRPGWSGRLKSSGKAVDADEERLTEITLEAALRPQPPEGSAGKRNSTGEPGQEGLPAVSARIARVQAAEKALDVARAQHAAAARTQTQTAQRLQEAERELEEVLKSGGNGAEAQALPGVSGSDSGANPGKPSRGTSKAPGGTKNSLGMVFVPVGDLEFSVFETRVKDYAKFVEEVDYPKTRWRHPGFDQTPDDPVVMVTWNDAMSFCVWLTERERNLGLLGPSDYYRLPTDLEWSKAVGLPAERGKTPRDRDGMFSDRFPWGTQWPPPVGVANVTGTRSVVNVSARGESGPFEWTAPVGTFAPNQYGLFDMSGNVWEWCMDRATPQSATRVLRGGSYLQGALREALLSSFRLNAIPDRETDSYGFRVVRSSDGGRLSQ